MKKLKIVWYFLAVLLIFCLDLKADESEGSDKAGLKFYTDFACFMADADGINSYLEIYISIPNYQMRYQSKGNSFFSAYEIAISLFDENKELKDQKTWQGFSTVDSVKQAENLMSLDVAAFMVPRGNYVANIKVTDLNANVSGQAEFPIKIDKFVDSRIRISNIQFARSIRKASEQNKFVKNGVEVLPNPSRAFGIESPFLYFYSEVYNIPTSEDSRVQLKEKYCLVDSQGDSVKSGNKTITPRGNSSIWVGKINIIDLISGRYDLLLNIYNQAGKLVAEQKADLWINNPYKVMTYKQYRKEDIEEFKAQIYYIVDESERKFFDQLEVPAKINYINNFWKNIDPDFRTEHLKRFYIAQQRFGSATIPGWKTDRGRVYIMYGPPDDVDRQPASLSTRAYEIWYYEHMRGQALVQFVFADLGIQGNYQLVHCDLRSGDRLEIYNPNWRDDIKISR